MVLQEPKPPRQQDQKLPIEYELATYPISEAWANHKWPKGTRVQLFKLEVNGKVYETLGGGELHTDYEPFDTDENGIITEDEAIMHAPQIKLDSTGAIIEGSECWWMPQDVIDAVRKDGEEIMLTDKEGG